jgi:hypothetical protein
MQSAHTHTPCRAQRPSVLSEKHQKQKGPEATWKYLPAAISRLCMRSACVQEHVVTDQICMGSSRAPQLCCCRDTPLNPSLAWSGAIAGKQGAPRSLAFSREDASGEITCLWALQLQQIHKQGPTAMQLNLVSGVAMLPISTPPSLPSPRPGPVASPLHPCGHFQCTALAPVGTFPVVCPRWHQWGTCQ